MSALDTAADMVADFEGFSGTAYLDPVGVPTIGYGSTRDWRIKGGPRVSLKTPPVNKAVGLEWLRGELQAALLVISKVPNLTDNEQAACMDFIYNLGAGAFASSTLRKYLVAGDAEKAAGEFEKWDHAGGKVLSGLLRRRKAEEALFTTPAGLEPATP